MALRKLLGLMVIFAAGRSQHNHLLREGAIVHNVAFCTCCIWRGNTTSLLHGEILPVVATIIAYTIPTKPLQAVVCLNLWLTRKCFFFFFAVVAQLLCIVSCMASAANMCFSRQEMVLRKYWPSRCSCNSHNAKARCSCALMLVTMYK